MGESTGISWTDSTWSPVVGCSRVSEGCRNCYAERLVATRLRNTEKYSGLAQMTVNGPRWTNVVWCLDDVLLQPLKWKTPRRIFVNSMSDTFHADVPDDFIFKMLGVMALCPHHTFQLLTKRPDRAASIFRSHPKIRTEDAASEITKRVVRFNASSWPLRNVWIGTSVENQAAADERIPHLLKIPAAVRFLSCEPLLGPLDLVSAIWSPYAQADAPTIKGFLRDESETDDWAYQIKRDGIHWLIAGGESGPNARPMHPDWARSLRDQCDAAGVAFHFQQWGEWGLRNAPVTMRNHHDKPKSEIVLPDGSIWGGGSADLTLPKQSVLMERSGVKASGHLLDGKAHQEFPEVARG